MLDMITPRTGADSAARSKNAAVQEAMEVLSQYQAKRTIVQRWVCERCGMIHTEAVPHGCESCGATTSLVQLQDLRREINSRW